MNLYFRVKSVSAYVLDECSDLPDELLYGRAGYLFCLLFLNSNISPPPIEEELIKQVFNSSKAMIKGNVVSILVIKQSIISGYCTHN